MCVKNVKEMEIEKIRFSLFSEKDIQKNAVCEITNTKMMGPNSVYDERMGTLQNGRKCQSCGLTNKDCVGHFGFIRLNMEIIHPLYIKQVLSILRCLCYKCNRLLITPEILTLHHLHKLPRILRLHRLVDKIEKQTDCGHCKTSVCKYIISSSDKQIYRILKGDHQTITRTLVPDKEAFQILHTMNEKDLPWFGYGEINGLHPEQMIIRVLPVLPPVARPYIISENVTCDDDLTIQYLEIIKANNHLSQIMNGTEEENSTTPGPSSAQSRKQKYIHLLKFRIRSLFDNSSGSSKHSNGRPLRGIKKRLTGKEGLIRNNLMGKRVDKSARSVIGPDPTLKTTEIAVPPEVAAVLCYSVRANRYNLEKIKEWIEQDKVNYIIRDNGNMRINARYALSRQQTRLMNGDWIERSNGSGPLELVKKDAALVKINKGDRVYRNGKWLEDVRPVIRKSFQIGIGDIIERSLMDGDILLLNRQPTLHKGSMIAQTVRIRPGKTIRMNLAVTKTFNADFDGDEMNLHCPASVETENELRELSSLKNHLVNCQSSQPNIVIVQDSLTGAYLMTREEQWLTRSELFQCMMRMDPFPDHLLEDKINTIETMGWDQMLLKGLQGSSSRRYHGRFLFSMILPKDFSYRVGAIRIEQGILLEGVITKKQLGSSHTSILAYLTKEYGSSRCIEFLDNVQFITNAFLMCHGFSIGLKDCIVEERARINEAIDRSFVKASSVEDQVKNEKIREAYMGTALSGARDTGMMIAQKSMTRDNNFITTVTSGSKGDFFNIAQITGVVGQQYLAGGRIPCMLSHQTRTLPHYPFEKSKFSHNEMFESRGFVRSSFVNGLNMREFFFHAMTGREGITDTAMKTATSGYIQRRMIKIAEDIQIQYDHTVRNNNQSIIQFNYGGSGLDPSKIMITPDRMGGGNGGCAFVDVKRIAERLNGME